MILETEIAFDDEKGIKNAELGLTNNEEPKIVWRPGVIDLHNVEAFCMCDYEGKPLPEATNLYTKSGMTYSINVPYDAMVVLMAKVNMPKPKTWEELIR